MLSLGASIFAFAERTMTNDAASLIDQVVQKYADARTLQFEGTIQLNATLNGEKHSERTSFKSSFQTPNRFRHDLTDEISIAADGSKAQVFMSQQNRFIETDTPDKRSPTSEWDARVIDLLFEQNPSMLLAAYSDGAKKALGAGGKVEMELNQSLPPEANDAASGSKWTVLSFSHDSVDSKVYVDPSTLLIRHVRRDMSGKLNKRGVPTPATAIVSIDYMKALVNEPVDQKAFTLAIPENATLIRQPAANVEMRTNNAATPIGSEAPDFELKDAGGKSRTLGEFAGKVLVLDFWATWCGPCRAGMPHLDKLLKANAEKGLVVFAVNLRETPEKAQKFIDDNSLSLEVLYDDGKVAQKYGVSGIPHSVVIGRDGKVAAVVVGYSTGDQRLTKAVEAALAK